VNDDFFSENFSASPKEVSPIQKEQIVVHEPQSVRESPPIAKQNNNQSTISSNADPHVSAKEVKRDDSKTVVNKSGHIDNEILNKFVKELEEQHSNNMKIIVTIMKENAAHAKELVIVSRTFNHLQTYHKTKIYNIKAKYDRLTIAK
jgi:hypothetical protein